jgi:hypothetical protein
VLAVAGDRFDDWIKFAGGMTVKLACDGEALAQWWHNVSLRGPAIVRGDGETVCDFK